MYFSDKVRNENMIVFHRNQLEIGIFWIKVRPIPFRQHEYTRYLQCIFFNMLHVTHILRNRDFNFQITE